MALIFKIVDRMSWLAGEKAGIFAGAPVDLKDGYVHLSTMAQVRETAARHFKGQDNLLIVAFAAESLGPALRWEPSRGGDLFPHLYAPLATALAVWVKPLAMRPDGTHDFPDLSEQ